MVIGCQTSTVRTWRKDIFAHVLQTAYDEDGNPKREKGVFYPDLGFVWGMEDDIS